MAHLIPLNRLARLVGQPRSTLQQMAQQGVLRTFDGQVELDEVLRHFPDVALDNEAELRRVEEIKEKALLKPAARPELPDAVVLHERLKSLSREFAEARGKLQHHERVHGRIAGRLVEAVERGQATAQFSEQFLAWFRRELATPAADLRPWEDLLAMERVMQVMSAQVTVLPTGQTFEVMGDETLLEAGLRAGLSLPYGCSNGTCGQCKCRVTSGQVVKVHPHDYVVPAAEKREGYTLACAYTAVGDISIEVPLWGVADIPEQTIVTRVRAVERLSAHRVALHLLTPRAERLRYLAGQQIEITVGGVSRIVPGAGCPCEERRLEVHVPCDGTFDRATIDSLKPNDEVTVRGPFGEFVLDDRSECPVLLVSSGPGFAPIKSLLQHALSLEHAPRITLCRLADADGFYQDNLLRSYAAALDHFHYAPLPQGRALSLALDDIVAELRGIAPVGLAGASGLEVPAGLDLPSGLEIPSSLSGVDVYVAGEAAFVEAARRRLAAEGLPASRWRGLVLE